MGVLVTTRAKEPLLQSHSLPNPIAGAPSPEVQPATGTVPSAEPTAHSL